MIWIDSIELVVKYALSVKNFDNFPNFYESKYKIHAIITVTSQLFKIFKSVLRRIGKASLLGKTESLWGALFDHIR